MTSRDSNRDGAIAVATDYLDSGGFEADLARRVAIPSETQSVAASGPSYGKIRQACWAWPLSPYFSSLP